MTLIQSEGIYVCKKCGNTTNAIIDSDRPNYKEPPPDISHFSYKRINHFNEFLNIIKYFTKYLYLF